MSLRNNESLEMIDSFESGIRMEGSYQERCRKCGELVVVKKYLEKGGGSDNLVGEYSCRECGFYHREEHMNTDFW